MTRKLRPYRKFTGEEFQKKFLRAWAKFDRVTQVADELELEVSTVREIAMRLRKNGVPCPKKKQNRGTRKKIPYTELADYAQSLGLHDATEETT